MAEDTGRSYMGRILSAVLPADAPAWRYYSGFYKGSHRLVLLSIMTSLLQSLILLSIALLVRRVFDDLIPSRNVSFLAFAGIGMLFLYVLNGGIALWTRHVALKATKTAIQRLRSEILDRFYALSRASYTGMDQSRLHTIMVQDTERLDIMSNALVAQMIPALLISAALGGVLIYLNRFLFLITAGMLPFLFLFLARRSLGKRVKRHVHAFHRSFERFSKGVWFVLQMMDLTRIQSAECFEIGRQRGNLEELRRSSGRMAWLRTAYALVQNTLVASFGVVILIVGGGAVATGHMTLGELLSFYTAVVLLKTHLSTLASCTPQILEGSASLATLFDFLETTDSRPYSGTKRIVFHGSITLESVSFQYQHRPLLRDIHLTIQPGRPVAVVGPNGAGKSTLAYLILGFYRPQQGGLYADGHPFDELDMMHLRCQMGVVAQDPILFPGTVRENITYGCPEASMEQIVQAARLATAHEFIETLPQGYDTFVGEKGVLLSGGQRQRIAIARALLRRPPFLILDEPTNHLDERAVSRLMRNLKNLDPAPAVLLISHDPHIAREAEHAYLLQEGYIAAAGHADAGFRTIRGGRDLEPGSGHASKPSPGGT